MRSLRSSFIALATLFVGLLAWSAPAWATNCNVGAGTCFWVGGTGTLNLTSDSAHWSNSTGGASCSCEPTATSTLTFDGASGGGTVTVTIAGGTLNAGTLVWGAFTGTIDFATSNNNVALTASAAFNGSGAGARTFNAGSGTWTITAGGSNEWNMGTITGLTNPTTAFSSSTLVFTVADTGTTSFIGGGLTYNIVTFQAPPTHGVVAVLGANTFATLNLGQDTLITFPNAATNTITNAFTWTGSAAHPIAVQTNAVGNTGTISVASGAPTMAYAMFIRDMTFSGGATFTATNSFNFGNVSGITVTNPTFGSGGGGIIGG